MYHLNTQNTDFRNVDHMRDFNITMITCSGCDNFTYTWKRFRYLFRIFFLARNVASKTTNESHISEMSTKIIIHT